MKQWKREVNKKENQQLTWMTLTKSQKEQIKANKSNLYDSYFTCLKIIAEQKTKEKKQNKSKN